jgi:hypothetical protein
VFRFCSMREGQLAVPMHVWFNSGSVRRLRHKDCRYSYQDRASILNGSARKSNIAIHSRLVASVKHHRHTPYESSNEDIWIRKLKPWSMRRRIAPYRQEAVFVSISPCRAKPGFCMLNGEIDEGRMEHLMPRLFSALREEFVYTSMLIRVDRLNLYGQSAE